MKSKAITLRKNKNAEKGQNDLYKVYEVMYKMREMLRESWCADFGISEATFYRIKGSPRELSEVERQKLIRYCDIFLAKLENSFQEILMRE